MSNENTLEYKSETEKDRDAARSDSQPLDVFELTAICIENIKKILVIPIAVGVVAFCASFIITPTFVSTVKFLLPQPQQNSAASMLQSIGAIGGLAGVGASLKNPADQHIALLRSVTVENALVARFGLQKKYDEKYLEDTRTQLEKNSRITSGKDGLINIEFTDESPQTAADIANAYVEEFSKLLNGLAVTEAQQRRAFFGKQLQETKTALVAAEQALAQSGVGTGTLNSNPGTALDGIVRLRAQATAQEVKVASMRSYVTENSPEFRQAYAELKAIRSELTKAEASQPAEGKSNEYIARYREFKYQETLFELFSKQFELARVDESREGALIQVVDPATPAEKKAKPRRATIAAVSGAIALIIYILYLYLRVRIKSASAESNLADGILRIKNAWK